MHELSTKKIYGTYKSWSSLLRLNDTNDQEDAFFLLIFLCWMVYLFITRKPTEKND